MDVAVRDPTSFSFSLRRYRVSLTLTQIVMTAGNNGAGVPVSSYPALFGDPNTKNKYPNFKGNREDLAKAVDNLIVVGASNQAGKVASFSQPAPWVTIYAPGEN